MKRLAAEFTGTLALVFVGTGSIIINDMAGGAMTSLSVSLAFGTIVFLMIYAFGDISGAHFNPAVSLGFLIARRFPLRELPLYASSQFCGAIAASAILKISFPTHQTLGGTHPGWTLSLAFIAELVLTTILMFVILAVSTRANERGSKAALAIGGTVAAAALFGGPISGASMNPARSLGPAVATTNLKDLWIYLTGPFMGAALAVGFCRLARPAGCRCEPQENTC